jgi:hypothetical protein
MREKCPKLSHKIAHYSDWRYRSPTSRPLMGIAGLIKMTADKAVMGCAPEKK